MALMSPSKLLLAGIFFTLAASIDVDGTCENSGACKSAAVQQARIDLVVAQTKEDVNALFQSKSAQVVTALDKSSAPPTVGPHKVADKVDVTPTGEPNKVSKRMQKLMEIGKTVDDIKTLGAAGETPEVATIIADLIRIIEEDLLPKIEEDHDFAKEQVVERMNELTQTTQSAVEEKILGDLADTSLDQCITDEERFIKEYETCKSEEAGLLDEKNSAEYCGHSIFDHPGYKDPPSLPDVLTIDFSKGLTNVNLQLDGYFEKTVEWMAATRQQAGLDHETWVTYDQRCREKTQQYEEKITECENKEGTWRAQYTKCLHVASKQEKALCQFGHAYQAKCASKTAYDNLHTDITGTGTPYSQPDRKQEYRQLARLTCVLDIFKSTTALTTGAVEQCTKSDEDAEKDFEAALGSIDLQRTKYEGLTSPANFACNESSIKFGNGVLWTLPTNNGAVDWIPKSGEYKKEEGYEYAIERDPSKPPFDFCLEKGDHETAPTCGSSTIDCSTGTGTQKDAGTKCLAAGGCTSADCCANMFDEAWSDTKMTTYDSAGVLHGPWDVNVREVSKSFWVPEGSRCQLTWRHWSILSRDFEKEYMFIDGVEVWRKVAYYVPQDGWIAWSNQAEFHGSMSTSWNNQWTTSYYDGDVTVDCSGTMVVKFKSDTNSPQHDEGWAFSDFKITVTTPLILQA